MWARMRATLIRGMWLKVFAGLLLTAAVSFVLSNLLLEGPDPEGWWNFVPAMLFYGSMGVAMVLGVVWAVLHLLAYPLARLRAGKTSG
jgi:hypothetical protein